MGELKLKKRHRLRNKEIRRISEQLSEVFGKDFDFEGEDVDKADALNLEFIILKSEIFGIIVDSTPFLTVKGLLKYKPERRFVTVDMGAVKFICSGADVMCPGIVDADVSIEEGNLVWIRDEKNLQPLAIGKALMSGQEMIEFNRGKAVKTIHHVGDRIWGLEC